MTGRPRGSILLLVSILLTAFAVRLAWTLWTASVPPAFSDAEYYNSVALSLAHGDGYSVMFAKGGFLPGGSPTFFWPPGYPALLATFHLLFGDGLGVARLANVIAGTMTVLPIYVIGLRLFGKAAGLTGAVIAATLPSFVFWTPVLLSETFFTLIFACAVAVVIAVPDTGTSRHQRLIVLLGLLLGAATLVRGQALVLAPFAAAWWTFAGASVRKATAQATAALVIAVAVIAPWTIRNVIVAGSPVLLSANLGYNLRIGHAPYSTGGYILPSDLWSDRPGISFEERERFFNQEGALRAVKYAVRHPLRELDLSGRKIMWLWRPDSDALQWATTFGVTPLPSKAWEPLRWLLDASYLAVLGLAATSTLILTLRRGCLFVAMLAAVWTATHIIFFGEPRYHLPLLVVIVPLAGGAVWAFAQKARERAARWPPLRAGGV